MSATKFYDSIHEINRISYVLRSLGNSFGETGNDKICKLLYVLADNLDENTQSAQKSYDELLQSSLNFARENTENILTALIKRDK